MCVCVFVRNGPFEGVYFMAKSLNPTKTKSYYTITIYIYGINHGFFILKGYQRRTVIDKPLDLDLKTDTKIDDWTTKYEP